MRSLKVITYLLIFTLLLPLHAQGPDKSEQLGMALEYFSSAKYHEALILFEQLDKEYKLNPRYHAYMGICYYYEWQYDLAVKYLESAIPQLQHFSPHERSVYLYANAESRFNLGHYDKAVPFYEQALTLCYDNEKGDAFYRLGFCHMFAEQWLKAYENFTSALLYYQRYRRGDGLEARINQIENMIKGCEKQLHKDELKYYAPPKNTPTDSIDLHKLYQDTLVVDSI